MERVMTISTLYHPVHNYSLDKELMNYGIKFKSRA